VKADDPCDHSSGGCRRPLDVLRLINGDQVPVLGAFNDGRRLEPHLAGAMKAMQCTEGRPGPVTAPEGKHDHAFHSGTSTCRTP
jgi:hypothetical protein